MNADDFPTPDADVETVAPATENHRIDAGEDTPQHDARTGSKDEEWPVDDGALEFDPNDRIATQESLAGN